MITAAEDTPGGTIATFVFNLEADYGITTSDTFYIIIGQYPALVLDMSTNQQSGEAY